jgi:trigger factor
MTLKIDVLDLSGCKKELVVELPAEDVRREMEKVHAELARHLKVPGFRPGKVPLSVVKQRFRRETRDELIRQLVPRLVRQALADKQMKLAGEPDLTDLSMEENQPLRLKATVEVFPDVQLKGYKGLLATKRVHAVTEKEIADLLAKARDSHAVLVPVEDRPSQAEDVATLLVTAQEINDDGSEGNLLSQEKEMQVELVPERLDPRFYAELPGMTLGETKSFVITYPKEEQPASLAGKTVRYTTKLTELQIKELPELDDEFAQAVGSGVETLDELKQKIKDELARLKDGEAMNGLREQLLTRLVDENRFDVPDSVVSKRHEEKLQEVVRSLMESGVDPSSAEINWDGLAEQARETAARELRAMLILEKIAELEQIEVSEAEVDAEISRLAARSQKSPIELKGRLTKQGMLDSIKGEIRNRRALEVVVASADVRTELIESEE